MPYGRLFGEDTGGLCLVVVGGGQAQVEREHERLLGGLGHLGECYTSRRGTFGGHWRSPVAILKTESPA
jgi:hypothetical protein